MLTEKDFQEKDFNKTKIFEEFVDNLNKISPKFDLKYFSARDLVIQFKRKTLILFKLILLQKKVLFMLSPIEHLVKTIMTLVSLIPNLIENGLNSCTLIDENPNFESELSLNESEDIVFSQDDENQLDFNRMKLKTLKYDEDEISSTISNDIEENKVNEEIKSNLLKRATSITNKLSDTFNRLTTTTTNLVQNCSQDLTHLDQFQFPIPLFEKVLKIFLCFRNKMKNFFRIIIFIHIYQFIHLI